MNFEEQFSKMGPPMYLKSATYLPEKNQVVLELTSDPEHTVKCAMVVFKNVKDYKESPLKDQHEEELFDSLAVIKGGVSIKTR
jgi:hypothetical protein